MLKNIETRYRDLRSKISHAYATLFENGSSYSAVTALFAAMFAMSLLLQTFSESRTQYSIPQLLVGIVAALSVFVYAIKQGRHLSKKVGLYMVAVHGAVGAYTLGMADYLVKGTSILQEAPLMAMYLAWFYPKKTARRGLIMYLGGILIFASIGPGIYLGYAGATLEIIRIVLFMWLCMELGFLWHGTVRAESQIDLLTGAISREGINPRMKKAIERAKRHNYPLSVAVIDLDGFKQVNDTLGHDAGDKVLIAVVNDINGSIRASDELFRLGGDEFVLLLPHATEDAAVKTLQRLHDNAPHQWSWGVAEREVGDVPESMILRADANMYKLKRERRGISDESN